ncbi:hypothetical protein LJ656_26990 [Paraburkholderia sp. MMS20-SJTR3]|uniref:Uncharacterized protein n=1 Tax=Paraburkholderia sejongensis TaxID=2886946 RepID=A0ABS8K2M1_9BURK|nr:hypothetical protein [Paraburkholderia sp. MMS20-SJTR3]MCC8396240.1 hypothetical protein [Paraburkholderia sp. MMS20-SJTR3]
MAIDFTVGADRRCTLCARREYHGSATSSEARDGRRLVASASSRELTRDTRQLVVLAAFMRDLCVGARASGAAPEQLAQALQAAVERGDVIAVVAKSLAAVRTGAPIEQEIRPYYETVTPSQLFRRSLSVVKSVRSCKRPALPRLAADDGLALWFAKPGDVLPDGTIATPVAAGLGEAQAFDFRPAELSNDVKELAASTNEPNYAAKMLGYDRKVFGNMVHAMKYSLDLRGDDNVIWHDNGDVEFNKGIIGNMHDYAY